MNQTKNTVWISICFALLLLLHSGSTMALGSSKSLYLGAGIIYQDANRTATTANGGSSLTGNSFFQVRAAGSLPINESWSLMPVAALTPFGAKGADADEKSSLLTIDARLTRDLGAIDLHFGPGVLFDRISGSGGTATLNNGSSTAVFGLPSGSSTARFFYVDVGIGVPLSNFRLDLDALITDTFSSRRAIYPTLNLSMGVF